MSDKQIVNCLGMELPMLADLGDGWWLVAHPNGPGIGTKCSLYTLDIAAFVDDCETMQSRAIDAYIDLTWPVLQKQDINSELLAALEASLPWVKEACEGSDYRNEKDFDGFAAVEIVEAAIAKAKGELVHEKGES